MKDLFDLLIQYWKPIVGLLFTITGFVIAIIKKRPCMDILTDIYQYSVYAINDVECLTIVYGKDEAKPSSEAKLSRALNTVLGLLHDKYPTLNVNKYADLIVDTIESILGTPHKKG